MKEIYLNSEHISNVLVKEFSNPLKLGVGEPSTILTEHDETCPELARLTLYTVYCNCTVLCR